MSKSALILVVDDSPDHVDILSQMLRSAGYQVAASRSPEAALRRARALKPNLIITDLAMPEVNGVDLIEQIRNEPTLKDTPVIVVTAHVWDHLAQAAGKVGADAFISKPWIRSELIAEVQKQLAGRQKDE